MSEGESEHHGWLVFSLNSQNDISNFRVAVCIDVKRAKLIKIQLFSRMDRHKRYASACVLAEIAERNSQTAANI